MPTTRPRYTLTDTGELTAMLDLAQQRWPDEHDRRRLLLLLAQAGADRVGADLAARDDVARRERQQRALAEARDLLDVEVLLSDAAWR